MNVVFIPPLLLKNKGIGAWMVVAAAAAAALVDTASALVLIEPHTKTVPPNHCHHYSSIPTKYIPCDEPEPEASSSGIGLEANEKSPFLKASYLVRTI